MIVMKFGGSSVANADRIRHVADIITAYRGERPLVVLSAMGDTTDLLLDSAEVAVRGTVDIAQVEALHRNTERELEIEVPEVDNLLSELKTLLTGISMLRELTNRTRDYLVSFGERLSVRITAAYLCKNGVEAKAYDAWDVGFVSDSKFTSADLLDEVWGDIPWKFSDYINERSSVIPIVTGFIAKNKEGTITTLGRGGSDLTATMLGSALGVKEIQTWKDVDGIMTADPRICPDAHPLAEVTYEEAQELALFGSQVLHPRSMVPCRKTGTPVRIKNSYNIKSDGTLIVEKHSSNPPPLVCSITEVRNVTLIDIQSSRMLGAAGFMAHIFNQFLKWNVSVDVVATSEVSVSLTIDPKAEVQGLVDDLRRVADVTVKRDKAIITIICDASRSSTILSRAFGGLEERGINVQMISQGASKVNISMIVDSSQADETIRTVHSKLFN